MRRLFAIGALIGAILGGLFLWRDYRWRHPEPGEVRTWFDPTNDAPRGGVRHLVGLDDRTRVLHVVHTPGINGCEFCW